jgi:cytochrome c oxidase subunit 2
LDCALAQGAESRGAPPRRLEGSEASMRIPVIPAACAALAAGLAPLAARAAGVGYAAPGQMGLQEPVTPVAATINWFHNGILLPLCIIISLFVLGLLAYVMVKFNENANPTPSKLTHHTGLEIAWTVIPVLILVVVAIPSFRLLRDQLVIPSADVTVKVTGKQWYWSYEYPKDQGGGFGFDSIMKPEKEIDLAKGDVRLLSVDNEAVVPVGKVVKMQVIAADVIHSFTAIRTAGAVTSIRPTTRTSARCT